MQGLFNFFQTVNDQDLPKNENQKDRSVKKATKKSSSSRHKRRSRSRSKHKSSSSRHRHHHSSSSKHRRSSRDRDHDRHRSHKHSSNHKHRSSKSPSHHRKNRSRSNDRRPYSRPEASSLANSASSEQLDDKGLSITGFLKEIELPRHIRPHTQEALQYQAEQLRIKVCCTTIFWNFIFS